MTTSSVQSKWWLAAIVLPIGVMGVGFLFALSAPFNQNDWLGMRFVVPVLYGFVAACLLSCLLAVISVIKKERRSGVALLAAIPCTCFLIWFGGAYAKGQGDAKRRAISEVARRKHEDEKNQLIEVWRDKLRANPELITRDDFWRDQMDGDQVAHLGLAYLLQEVSFDVTPEIKDFVLTQFPDDYMHLAHRRLLTKADLEIVVRNPKTGPWPREFAARAIKEGNYKTDVSP